MTTTFHRDGAPAVSVCRAPKFGKQVIQMIVNRVDLPRGDVLRECIAARQTVAQCFLQKPWLAAIFLVVVLAIPACSRAGGGPTPLVATPTVASSPLRTPVAMTPSKTIDVGGTATTPVEANATTTAQSQATVVAQAVDATMTAHSQAIVEAQTVDATKTPQPQAIIVTQAVDATTMAESQATVVAQAVDATVTVRLQALASAAVLSVQETATAAAPSPAGPTATAVKVATSPTPVLASPAPSAVSVCSVKPLRGFGLLYTTNAAVASRLGCALDAEVGSTSTTQTFEGGFMLWMAKQIFVFHTNGAGWSVYVDKYQNGQPLPTPTVVAPVGRFAPDGSFGLLWEQQKDVRSQVGWATAPPQAFTTGAEERFAHGSMVWTPNLVIYVLYSDNTWQSFPDTFQG